MKRIACMAGVLAVFIAGAFVSGKAGAGDDADSIKAVMQKLHKGADSPLNTLKTQLKSESPNWTKVQEESKDLVILGASLAKFAPPRGEAASYKKLATNYYNHAKAVDDAAQKQDAAATKAALTKLNASCKECHSAHKGQ